MRFINFPGVSSRVRIAGGLVAALSVALVSSCGGNDGTIPGTTSQSTLAAGGSGGAGGGASVGGGGAGQGGAAVMDLEEAVHTIVDKYAKPLVSSGVASPTKAPGGIVGVYINMNTFFVPYGAIDDDKYPPTENTIFGIGTMTKVLTASILGQFPSRFNDPVTGYMPPGYQLQAKEQPVTFTQLATFSGGIPSDTPACHQKKFQEFINLVTPPGGTLPAKTTDSDSSIGFLGQVLMHTDNYMSFGPANTTKWFQYRLLSALNMSHTTTPAQPDADHLLATPYIYNATISEYESIAYPPFCPWGTASQMFSTAGDLVRFIQANVGVGVIEGDVVSATLLDGMREALKPRPDAVNPEDDQAFAWTVFPEDPTHKSRVRGKAGAQEGVSAYIAVNPELAYGVVLLMNMSDMPAEQPVLDIMKDLLPIAASGLQ
jgi:CubicO group peptidase (beta-lactamase class C family)